MSGINILVVGAGMYVCGKGTEGHGTILPAIIQLSKKMVINKVVVCATSLASIQEFKKKHLEIQEITGIKFEVKGFPETTNDPEGYKKLVEAVQFDCAIISTPDHTHFSIAKFLLEKKIHLLVVKPLAPSLKEASALAKLASENNLIGMVEFHKRYDKSNLKLKDALTSGQLGAPLYFIVEYSQRKIIPTKIFKDWVDKTNIFQYLGVHYVDIVYFCTGAKPLRLMALGQNNYLSSMGVKALDSIQCIVEWKNKDGSLFTSTFHTNWIDPSHTSSMSDQRIKVIGTLGRFEADQKDRGVQMVTDKNQIEVVNPDFCSLYTTFDSKKEWRGYGIESVQQFIYDVVAYKKGSLSIAEINSTRPSFESSLTSVAIIDAANKSLEKNGEWISVEAI